MEKTWKTNVKKGKCTCIKSKIWNGSDKPIHWKKGKEYTYVYINSQPAGPCYRLYYEPKDFTFVGVTLFEKHFVKKETT